MIIREYNGNATILTRGKLIWSMNTIAVTKQMGGLNAHWMWQCDRVNRQMALDQRVAINASASVYLAVDFLMQYKFIQYQFDVICHSYCCRAAIHKLLVIFKWIHRDVIEKSKISVFEQIFWTQTLWRMIKIVLEIICFRFINE